ncbi:MAG: diaminopimelate epimerase [Bacteroidetes bacterium]|nr:diaminopimelate epimerase [Bacteroidota bacterium]MCL5027348.1 diaminopimelate epimerase [Chloroflexota bacterium]
MEFFKMHGAGNDFVLLDARDAGARERDWPALARAMCDRHFGVGSDGLLLVLPSTRADYRMRMFNPDGSEAEMCGNGIRCFAKYLYDRGIHASLDLRAETLAGIRQLRIVAENGRARRVQVGMGAPILRPADIPVVAESTPVIDLPLSVDGADLQVTCVSMGNPHAVAFISDDPDTFPLNRIGPLVERHPLFPRRVNFEIVQVRSPREAKARVWERGAGLTLACGTGACAVAVAARLKGLTEPCLRLELPGGRLELAWDGAGEVLMTGPAETVFRGEWPE